MSSRFIQVAVNGNMFFIHSSKATQSNPGVWAWVCLSSNPSGPFVRRILFLQIWRLLREALCLHCGETSYTLTHTDTHTQTPTPLPHPSKWSFRKEEYFLPSQTYKILTYLTKRKWMGRSLVHRTDALMSFGRGYLPAGLWGHLSLAQRLLLANRFTSHPKSTYQLLVRSLKAGAEALCLGKIMGL